MAGSGVWRCRKCRFLNLDVATCQKCGADISPKLAKALEEQQATVRFRWQDEHTGGYQETYSAPSHEAPPAAPFSPPTPLSSSPTSRPPTLPPNELPPWEQPIPRAAPSEADQEAAAAGTPVRPPRPGAGRRAVRTVVGIIVANVVLQVVMAQMAADRHLDASGILKVNLGFSVAFFGGMAILVALRGYELDISARWLVGPVARAVVTGLVIGAAAAAVLATVLALSVGHMVTDPFAALISEQTFGRFALGVFVLAVLGPFAEEFVFRGFLLEAFRRRGRTVALFASALAFGLAHLRFGQLWYFTLLGIALGGIYLKRGLLASWCAHGAFNGSLVLVAIIASHGSPVTYHVDGLALRLPAAWHEVAVAKGDFAAFGPGAAQLSVAHFNLPSGPIDLSRVAAALQSGAAQLPGGVAFDPSTVQLVKTPVGSALRLRVTLYNHPDDGALLVVGSRLIVFDFLGNGSARARQDFDGALQDLRLAGLP
jgi:membrane protease YdiL (CAAX protease family)